jgi:transcriptional regulator with XRE-family HTH domain
MDVQVDRDLIRSEREKRAWSQEHLASAAGIGARTIQRIEATGVASYESVRAISAALEIPIGALRVDGASPRTTTASSGEAHSARSAAPAPPFAARHARARLRFALRWLGAAAALAMLAAMSGFLLLQDYKKVRVLRTFEQWVTAEPSLGAANTADGR